MITKITPEVCWSTERWSLPGARMLGPRPIRLATENTSAGLITSPLVMSDQVGVVDIIAPGDCDLVHLPIAFSMLVLFLFSNAGIVP